MKKITVCLLCVVSALLVHCPAWAGNLLANTEAPPPLQYNRSHYPPPKCFRPLPPGTSFYGRPDPAMVEVYKVELSQYQQCLQIYVNNARTEVDYIEKQIQSIKLNAASIGVSIL